MIIRLLLLSAAVAAITGCVGRSPVKPALVSVVSGPESATANPIGSKTGRSCAYNLLGILAWGDATIEAAARQGGIRTVSHVDYESIGVSFIWESSETVVHGE